VIAEYRAYCRRFRKRRVFDTLEQLISEAGIDDLRYAENDLWRLVREAVRSHEPFSLVRLSDGEGNVLMWGSHAAEYPALASWCLRSSWISHLGAAPYSEALWTRLFEGLAGAIANADFLGIPWREDIQNALAESERYDELETRPIDPRGVGGYPPVWDYLANETALASLTAVTNRRCQASLPNHIARLIQEAGNVSAISCYPDLVEHLHRVAGVSDGETIIVPPQAAYKGLTAQLRQQRADVARGEPHVDIHFPSRFDQISAALSRSDLSGRLFLVAAGMVGKAYCRVIKGQGGMAIDAGSIVDAWEGQAVRPYHTPELVAWADLTKRV
jgi:hypothetical protein